MGGRRGSGRARLTLRGPASSGTQVGEVTLSTSCRASATGGWQQDWGGWGGGPLQCQEQTALKPRLVTDRTDVDTGLSRALQELPLSCTDGFWAVWENRASSRSVNLRRSHRG